MKNCLYILIFIGQLFSCNNVSTVKDDNNDYYKVLMMDYYMLLCESGLKPIPYFNEYFFNDTTSISELKEIIPILKRNNEMWFQILDSVKEPIFFQEGNIRIHHEIYRLYIASDFTRNVEIYRLERSGPKYILIHKEVTFDSLTQKTKLFQDSIQISTNFVEIFKEMLEGAYFWDLYYENYTDNPSHSITWQLEGIKKNHNLAPTFVYNSVRRDNPRNGSFKQACEYLISLYQNEKPSR